MQNPDGITLTPDRPLICALEGALVNTDVKSERLLLNARNSFSKIFSSTRRRSEVAVGETTSGPDSYQLPFNVAVYDFLVEERSKGRRVLLDTAETTDSIDKILPGENFFSEVINTSTSTTPEEFDYIGTDKTREEIWHSASQKYMVGPEFPADFAGHFFSPQANFKSVIKAIRAYQWLKNLLVFVPLITSQQLANPNAISNTLIMFLGFSAVASFGYIFNDLLDLQSDRHHKTKRNRPFANGVLGIKHGFLLGALLLAIAAIASAFLPAMCSLILLTYLLLTISYSIYLKTKLMADVVTLGGLFTLRVIGGAAAIETELSFYLLSFSVFLFSSLAMVKRFAELHNLQVQNKNAARGRDYRVEDMAPVRMIGISLGYMSVFIMGLYINSPLITEYYSNPKVIWLLFPLLTYWLGRLWILANRGEVNEDPLIFTIKDRTSLLVAAISAVILIVAN